MRNTSATISPSINAGYIYLNTKRHRPVQSMALNHDNDPSGPTDIVLDFDNETGELVGIEFLDLALMPQNWQDIAHNHDAVQE